jgi:hypothetical protein
MLSNQLVMKAVCSFSINKLMETYCYHKVQIKYFSIQKFTKKCQANIWMDNTTQTIIIQH